MPPVEQNEGQPIVDARGFLCPLPVLKARKALLALAPGAELVLLATDPMARIDIPHFCAQGGHTLVEQLEADGYLTFRLRRGPHAP